MGDLVVVDGVDQTGEVACRVCPHRRVRCNACNGSGHIAAGADGQLGDDGCPWCDGTGEVDVEQDYRRQPTDEHATECYLVRFVCTSQICGLSCEVPVTVVLPAD
eukprot:gene26443-16363_t